MDQQAFRQLISTPRNEDAGQSSPTKSRQFGKQKRTVAKESPLHSADLVPRKLGGSSSRASSSSVNEKPAAINSTTGESYVDRAEARRLGIDEFNDAETLRKDYEDRIKATEDEEEREKLRKQMKHLSEDAKFSAVVRGLDHALLAQQKAKLNGIGNGNGVEIDDKDLEEAYGSGGIEVKSSQAIETQKEVVSSKFKPIGFKSVGKDDEGQPEYIWRDGKRLRKKKKEIEVGNGDRGESSKSVNKEKSEGSISKKAEMDEKIKQALKKKNDQEKREMPPPQIMQSVRSSVSAPLSPKVAAEKVDNSEEVNDKGGDSSESDDDSTDIFADAGRWDGLDDDDDEEDGEVGETVAVAPFKDTSASGKRDWFNTGKGEEHKEGQGEVTLPSSLTSILDNAHEAKRTHEAAEGESSGSEDEEGEVQGQGKSERLEGFSDSILGREGVRYMLEKQDDDRNDQKRKRKRSKKGKGGYGSD